MKWVEISCNNCGHHWEIPKARLSSSTGPPLRCPECGFGSAPRREGGGKGATVQQKRSRDQERRAAKRDGGRVRPASGSMDHAKGDVYEAGVYLKECKYTAAKSYSLKPDVVDKVTSEAGPGETPVLEIEFQGIFPKRRVYVLPEWAWEEYLELKRCQS